MALVRLDDPLHEPVAHDVLVPEVDELDPVDRAEDVLHLNQPGGLLARQVDLRHVAGDHDLRAEAEPREEHLHLLGRGVLRLVEDDEAVVEGAAAHERERRHLDRAALHVRAQLLRVHRVVERVEQRPHVRVDLGEHVAGQEAEPLAGLHGGAGQDEATDLPLRERRHGERDREVRLARAGRPDPEGDGAAADRVDVALLRHGLRRDPLAAVRPDDVGEDLPDVLGLVDRGEDRVDRAGADLLPALDELDELLDDGAGLGHLQVITFEREPVAAQVDRAAEPLAERGEHAVTDPGELGRDLVRNVHHCLHTASVGAPAGAQGPTFERQRPGRDFVATWSQS